jgi:hypothetical protein
MWEDILAVAKALYDQVEAAKKNTKQARLLGDRVKQLLDSIEADGKHVLRADNQAALVSLKKYLEDAGKVVEKFNAKYRITQFIQAGMYQGDLKDLHTDLTRLVQTFSVVTQMQGLMDARKDRDAMQDDLSEILPQLQELNEKATRIEAMEKEELEKLEKIGADVAGVDRTTDDIAAMEKQELAELKGMRAQITQLTQKVESFLGLDREQTVPPGFWIFTSDYSGKLDIVHIGTQVKTEFVEDASEKSMDALERIMKAGSAVLAEQKASGGAASGGAFAPGSKYTGDQAKLTHIDGSLETKMVERKGGDPGEAEEPPLVDAEAMKAAKRERDARNPNAEPAGADTASGAQHFSENTML